MVRSGVWDRRPDNGRFLPAGWRRFALVIAALFNPLRRRIQDFIDRRFYRQKYNAEQALAQFAETAGKGTDLENITEELLQTIQKTMHPESASLWVMKGLEHK